MIKCDSKMLNVIVKQECLLYKKSEDYRKTLQENAFCETDKITIQILSVYNKIQEKLLKKELELLRKENSMNKALELLFVRSRDNMFLEGELFQLARCENDEELSGDVMSSFCGMVSNENMELLELIEKELFK